MKWSKTGGLIAFGVTAFVLALWALSLWKRPHDDGKAKEAEPVAAAEFWERGQKRYREGDLDGTIADMKKLVDLEPTLARGWGVIAEISLGKQDFPAAEAAYSEIIRLSPKSPAPLAAALANRGLLRIRLGKTTEGLDDLDRAVEANPLAVEARMTRAGHLQYNGKFTEAIRDYDEVLKLQPDQIDALVARGLARQYSGNLDGAEKDLRLAEAIKPDRFDIQADLALLLKQKGDEAGAEASLQKAIKILPAQEAGLRENMKKVPASKK